MNNEILYTILIVLGALIIFGVLYKSNKNIDKWAKNKYSPKNMLSVCFDVIYFLSFCLCYCLIVESFIESDVKAIDVYRGKTKLSITEIVKDGVVVKKDSLVVYK